jgi:hypothetical protein
LIYVDPARTDYVIPFNVLATVAEHPYDIAAAVLEAFRRIWPELCWSNNTSVLGGLLCNHYEGSCKVTRDSLSVSDVFATQMGCLEPEGILEQKNAYLTVLRTAATHQIAADRLEMFDGAGSRVLVFVAQETDSCLSFSCRWRQFNVFLVHWTPLLSPQGFLERGVGRVRRDIGDNTPGFPSGRRAFCY